MQHFPRYAATQLTEALADTPAVCLLGPRQTGKTTLVRELEPNRSYISFDDTTMLDTARTDPTSFVQGLPETVTLDEIQRVPELLPEIKASIDSNRKPGKCILTGSANLLLLPGVQESLAGRVEIIYLNPLSEQEKHARPVSFLSLLLTNKIKPAIEGQQREIEGVAKSVIQGGYPEPVRRNDERAARRWFRSYLNTVIQRDVKNVANVRDEDELLRLVEILALRSGNLLNLNALANELRLRRETVDKDIRILEQLFLLRRLPAWHRNNAKRLVKAPKIHLIDSGIASFLCNLKLDDWFDPNTGFGPILESHVVQQLICQSSWVDGEFRFTHYRDKDQIEVDLVMEEGKHVWGVEVKKATRIQSKDGAGLSRLADHAGKNWQGGVLLYTGNNCLALKSAPNTFAVPMNWLSGTTM